MKKLLLLAAAVLFCLGSALAEAAADGGDNPLDWSISMQEAPKAAPAAAADTTRWSAVLENNLGVYAFDVDSLHFSAAQDGVVNKDLVAVLTKTVFTDKPTLKKLQAKYKNVLQNKEKVQYCEILMTFNIAEGSYGVNYMDVFTNQHTLLEHSVKELRFVPVPPYSFAEAMLEICRQAAAEDAAGAAAQ